MNDNRPLGPPIRPPQEQPKPEWYPLPDKPYIERNAKGELRTKLPDPVFVF